MSAYLHDIGYAEEAAETGFHALDGARYLARRGVDSRICRLVAHHSCAVAEAEQRSLLDELLREFPPEESAVADALWFCDMTVGPGGEPTSLEARLTEILARYGDDHVVSRSMRAAEPSLLAAVRRTERRLEAAGTSRQQM